ncbi:MAG: carbonic anhydrase/acetyltransferase-like protein (isoleucine patch superfamily) [Alphaproteobacteria bacterium]|jgi:carbonic anhydrase/acetyltransferase-like protein (isoleucine patch superfamily)
MTVLAYKGASPKIAADAFIAGGSTVIGDTVIGEKTSIWYNVTIRGDVNTIRIGKHTNIQDGSTCHVSYKTGPLVIGDYVTIGHNAIVHGCTLEDHAFVGMGAMVLDGAVVSSHAMLAAGALLTNNKVVPTGEIWAGNPAKFFRKMTDKEMVYAEWSAEHYVKLGQEHASITE